MAKDLELMDTPTALKSMDAHSKAGTLEQQAFDIHDDDLMSDLCAPFGREIQDLLLYLESMESGAATNQIKRLLIALRDRVKDEWRLL